MTFTLTIDVIIISTLTPPMFVPPPPKNEVMLDWSKVGFPQVKLECELQKKHELTLF